METLGKAVLPRFARFNEPGANVLDSQPDAQITGNKFRTVVAADKSWCTTLRNNFLQDGLHLHGGEGLCDPQRQRLPGKFIRQCEYFQGCPFQRLIEDEIVSPEVVSG